ncbi:MAG: zinc ribbon domain-containing protein [Pseudomonadales bacterium]|nr:zinc ribbon domain-containing protein [Pseudomonadales bacterium]
MPVYDYKCKEHGLFHELATLDKSGEPCPCPRCGALSSRVIMIPPEILAMAPNQRNVQQRKEKAQHEPIISTVDSRAEAEDRHQHAMKRQQHKQGHVHGHSCGCSHEHKTDRSALKQQVVLLPDGSKVFPSQRPWMISH